MLWTVFEESSEDGDHYDRPPPGDLESYYDLASQQSHTQEMVELTSSGSQDVNSKKEASEKQVVEAMVVPAEDEFEEEENHQQEDIEADSQQQSSNFLDGGSWAWLVVLALIIPNITLRQRLPLRNVSGGLFNFQAFKNPPFLAYAIAAFTGFLGLYTVPTYIELSALAVSVLPNIAIYLVAIANAGAGLGSLFAVIMMDRIGALNFLAPTTLIAGVLSFLWPFSRTEASSIVIAALYGFMCGSFVSGLSVPVYKLGELSDSG
ncbi:hypothetical protein EV368DRAFT_86560 [Lentinula lateritia]|nr:hypothetical protein EV368DRAFT_86560 [Lentinula lateritia]